MIDFLNNYITGKQERLFTWLAIKRGNTKSNRENWFWHVGDHISNSISTEEGLIDNPPWGLGEPSSLTDCVAVDSTLQWKWNSVSCSISAYVVCQNDGVHRYKKYKPPNVTNTKF